jgi:ATP-dependent Zn protease
MSLFEISFHCSYSMSGYPSHNANIETMKKTEIQHKVDDKIFQKVLRSFALYYNATQLFNSTCNVVTFSAQSFSPTSSASSSESSNSLSGSEITALVLGIIFGVCFCFFFLVFCLNRRSRFSSGKVAVTVDNQYDENINNKYIDTSFHKVS